MSSSMILKKRTAAAIRGAFIADAASMGTHWIYDPLEMRKSVPSFEEPEFKTPAEPKFYSSKEFPGHYKSGMLSPYGEQLLFVSEHTASTPDLDGETMSEEMLLWSNTFGGRPDSALKTFQQNMQKRQHWPNCGADDDQAHIYMKIVPVVGRYAGTSQLIDKVTLAIRVHQNNDKAVAFGIASARLLEAVLLGAPLEEALETVQTNIVQDLDSNPNTRKFKDDVLQAWARGKQGGTQPDKTLDGLLKDVSHEMMAGKEDSPFYDLAARSCALPGSFIGPIALFYKHASTPPSSRWVPALRENILGSGDTCSRAVFVGAVLAAAATQKEDDYDKVIPKDWVRKMDVETLKRIDTAIRSIAKHK